jgi:alpha-L-fucosidase
MPRRALCVVTVALVTLVAVACDNSKAQQPSPPPVRTEDAYASPRTQWYRDAKYGMFIHWGIYAIPAGEWKGNKPKDAGEWIMHHQKIPIAEYEPLAKQFNPVKFDAKQWVAVAKDAGMKYVVITSKHHDGFCMWDTAVTDYNVVKATPWKHDPMKDLSEACKAAGIKFAFYHSIMDWHHPELAGYWNADRDAAKKSDDPRVDKYVEGQLKPQLKELVTKYDPAILWFDGEWVPWWTEQRGRDIEKFLIELKPDLIINNRVGKRKMTDGDYETPEQEIPAAALGKRLWETCMTLNDTWGYKHFDNHWKQPQDVVRKLADIAGKGGNFLLNVGPTGEGEIPAESVRILREAGQWVRANGEAIYGTNFALAAPLKWGSVTRKGNSWYLIVFDWPKDGKLTVPAASKVKGARLLAGGGEVKVAATNESGVQLQLPTGKPSEPAAVVVLEFEGDPKAVAGAGLGDPIPPSIDRSFTLPAGAAVVKGGTAKVEPAGNIGFWTSPQDYVEWVIDAKDAGRFDVSLTLAVAPGAGGEYTVSVGDQKLTGRAEPTGRWQNYRTVKVGRVNIPAGRTAVTVRPKGKFNEALMNLQSVKLDPA